jgi:hypothetical protein
MGVDFTLSDLTDDMIVETRDGEKYLIVSDGKIMMGVNSWVKIEHYDNDLTNRDNRNCCSLNIDKVWKITSKYGYASLDYLLTDNHISRMIECDKIELVFDRNAPKVKKMTIQQICDELGYEVEIVKE